MLSVNLSKWYDQSQSYTQPPGNITLLLKNSDTIRISTSLEDEYHASTYPASRHTLTIRPYWAWEDEDETCTNPNCYIRTHPDPSVKDRLHAVLRTRMFPAIRTTRSPLVLPVDERERRARETLRKVSGESQFRNYLKYGFVTARAKSGRHYQIFPGMKMTKVFEQGALIEELCTYVAGNFPATDQVIVRFLMILNSEEDFRQRSNVFSRNGSKSVLRSPAPLQFEERSLVDIYKGFTRKVA